MKLIRLIKMCLHEMCSRVRVDKYLSDILSIKNGLKEGDALSPLLFDFSLEYAVRRIKVNQDGLKLNGAHLLLVYADYVNILGESVHNMKKNIDTLIVTSKDTGLQVNADKTKCMVMSRNQNARRSHNTKIVNSSLERVEEFKYLGTNLTRQNSVQEEIKSRMKSGNACYCSVQSLLSASLLYKE